MEERATHCYKRSASGILLCSVGHLTLDGPWLTSRGKGPIPPGGVGMFGGLDVSVGPVGTERVRSYL